MPSDAVTRRPLVLQLANRSHLAPTLAAIACLLVAPCLFLDFYQDDFLARYVFSELAGAEQLYRAIGTGYGISDGDPAENHWQAEAGFAPWWIDPRLRLAMLRPLSQITHMFDVRVWPDNPVLQRLQSFAWLAWLVVIMTRMYRRVLGHLVGGLAALLFAIDHTHGFSLGFISNRHALVAAAFAALSLDAHLQWRMHGERKAAALAIAAYVASLFASEFGVSIAAYVAAYALFVEQGSLWRRGWTVAPYLIATVAWRAVYVGLGFGAEATGAYVDPARHPLEFLAILRDRAPLLVTGQFFVPPADIAYVASGNLLHGIWILTVVFAALLAVSFAPLLARDRVARFWAAGMLLSLVPASTTVPHSRQLILTSFGAMALLAQLWSIHAPEAQAKPPSRLFRWSGVPGLLALMFHLLVSPIAKPLTACSIAVQRDFQAGVDRVQDDIADRDLIVITAPDSMATRLLQLRRRVEHRPLARRWRALAFGRQEVTVHRPSATTLVVDYADGVPDRSFVGQLYRSDQHPMHVGEQVTLDGLRISVTAVNAEGRVASARFDFDTALDDPRFVYYCWGQHGFEHFTLPAIGSSVSVPAA